MDIIINQPQLVKVVKLYLTKFFGDLTPKTISKYPNSVFYVNSDNDIFIEYNEKNKVIWIDNDLIWSKLERYFYLKDGYIQLIIKDWLEEHYNLRGTIPEKADVNFTAELEEHYNLIKI